MSKWIRIDRRYHQPYGCYDRARTSLDRHATYIVAAYVAGAAR